MNSETNNPYQAPRQVEHYVTWWDYLKRLLFGRPKPYVPRLENGDLIFCDGIGFFTLADEPAILYAVSASTDSTPRRMNLIVAETIRVLPYLIVDNPSSEQHLGGRKLVIRALRSYASYLTEFDQETKLDWDILSSLLSDDPISAEPDSPD